MTAKSNISGTYLRISNKITFLRKMRMFNIVFNFFTLTKHCLVHPIFKMLHIEVTFPLAQGIRILSHSCFSFQKIVFVRDTVGLNFHNCPYVVRFQMSASELWQLYLKWRKANLVYVYSSSRKGKHYNCNWKINILGAFYLCNILFKPMPRT